MTYYLKFKMIIIQLIIYLMDLDYQIIPLVILYKIFKLKVLTSTKKIPKDNYLEDQILNLSALARVDLGLL